jgi:hypothetical protein
MPTLAQGTITISIMSSSLSATRPTDSPLRVLAGKSGIAIRPRLPELTIMEHEPSAIRQPGARAERNHRAQNLAPLMGCGGTVWRRSSPDVVIYAFRGGYGTAHRQIASLDAQLSAAAASPLR